MTPMNKCTTDERDYASRAAILSAAVLGLAWMGDSLIYVVLPLNAVAFGIELPLVGLVLSLNRIVRILGYGWIGALSRRFGGRLLMALAAFGAALSTIAYGLAQGVAVLIAARFVWGLAYGVLNVLSTVYALGRSGNSGWLVGLSRAISTLGPAVALSAGAAAATVIGPQWAFIFLGLLGLLAVPLALALPDLGDVAAEETPIPNKRWVPSSLNLLFFAIMLAVDGIFPMTLALLLSQWFSTGSAMLTAGLMLACLRVATVVGSLIGGKFVDRVGAQPALILSVMGIIFALFCVAAGHLYIAAAIITLARSTVGTTGAVLVGGQTGGTKVERMAALSTWADCGLAAGPLIGGSLFTTLGVPMLYALLGIILALALAIYLFAPARERRDDKRAAQS